MEIIGAEAAARQQGDRQRIANAAIMVVEVVGARPCGAGLRRPGQDEGDIQKALGERALRPAGDRDQGQAEALGMEVTLGQLRRPARNRKGR